MQFVTKFVIGQRVRRFSATPSQAASALRKRSDPTFTIGQVRLQTLKDGVVLIEYRANYTTGRNGPWIAERYLRMVEN